MDKEDESGDKESRKEKEEDDDLTSPTARFNELEADVEEHNTSNQYSNDEVLEDMDGFPRAASARVNIGGADPAI